MPKMRSHSGMKKRAKKTGSGKFTVKKNSRNHLLQQKSKRQKNLSRKLVVSKSEHGTMKKLLPYT